MGRIAFGLGFAAGAGLGAIPYATRSTDSQTAVFISIAARDTYYTNNPGDLTGDLAAGLAAVGIGPNDGDPVGVTAAFIRNDDNTGWIPIATNFVGAQGPAGESIRRMFESVAARDTYYSTQTNRDTLEPGVVISVNAGNNVIEFQQWAGGSQPTSHDTNNWVTTSLRTASASVNFGEELRLYNYGEFVGFEDQVNSLTALAIGQIYSDAAGSSTARQLSFPAESTLHTTTGTLNSPSATVHEFTFDTTGIITNPAILLSNTINFVTAPNFYITDIWLGTDDTGQKVFNGRQNPAGVAGIFTARSPSPQRFLPNSTYFIRFTGDIAFQYAVATGQAEEPVSTYTGFEFVYEDLATRKYVDDNASVVVQDEGVDLDTRGVVLNFTGAGVTASGAGITKTINVPGGGGSAGINIQDEGNPLQSAAETLNFTGTGVTVTGTGTIKTVDIPGTTSPVTPTPSLHDFTIDIPSRVDLNTDLNVSHIVNYSVTNFTQLTALNLVVTTGDDKALTLPVRDGLQAETITLTGISTAVQGTVTFQLSGTHSGGTVTSNVVTINVQNLADSEQAYYGARATNDFSSVATSLLTSVDVTNSGTVYNIAQSTPDTYILGILSPANRDPVSIFDTILNVESRDSFAETPGVRTINGVVYNLRTIANSSGFTGTFNYRVTTE